MTMLNQLDGVTKTAKKKKAQPKQKGKRGETYFAEQFSKASGLHFHRIFSSGATVGKSNNGLLTELTQNQAEAQLGDVQCPENLKHYIVLECKNYVELDFHNLYSKKGCTKVNGWIDELEYDLQSAFSLMKDNYRQIAGFLCVKITRKGTYIIGNKNYILKTFFENKDIQFQNVLFFNKKSNEFLKNKGFGDEYFMTDFESFIDLNKEQLFIIDKERELRIEKAKEYLTKMGLN